MRNQLLDADRGKSFEGDTLVCDLLHCIQSIALAFSSCTWNCLLLVNSLTVNASSKVDSFAEQWASHLLECRKIGTSSSGS
jgi:hypothetical protein